MDVTKAILDELRKKPLTPLELLIAIGDKYGDLNVKTSLLELLLSRVVVMSTNRQLKVLSFKPKSVEKRLKAQKNDKPNALTHSYSDLGGYERYKK